ncbi:helix-turn-helix domain-containing protein [Acaryochloris marina]|uniref:helix-turn-helix domain-containing protein n=1 Tax=Acaryochloris marina TaxID=155978 RepID=UPI000674FDCF|nr:helix-turn-helix transcriptional regulator [Acaryochloris marina]
MKKVVINWKLAEVMQANGISPTDLAAEMKISRNAISKMRKHYMPRMDGEKLNNLLISLNTLRKPGKRPIRVSHLIVESYTLEEMERAKVGEST